MYSFILFLILVCLYSLPPHVRNFFSFKILQRWRFLTQCCSLIFALKLSSLLSFWSLIFQPAQITKKLLFFSFSLLRCSSDVRCSRYKFFCLFHSLVRSTIQLKPRTFLYTPVCVSPRVEKKREKIETMHSLPYYAAPRRFYSAPFLSSNATWHDEEARRKMDVERERRKPIPPIEQEWGW